MGWPLTQDQPFTLHPAPGRSPDDAEPLLSLQRPIERDDLGCAGGAGAFADAVVCEVAAAGRVRAYGALDRRGPFDFDELDVEQRLERTRARCAVELVPGGQDPDELAEHGISNVDGLSRTSRLEQQSLSGTALLRVIADDEPDEDVRVDGDHAPYFGSEAG